MSCVSGVCSPTAANAVLNVGDLTSMLAAGSVTVNTGTGSLAAQVEDITVAATFNWASANALTLDAYRSVTFTAPVAVNGVAPVSLVTNDGGSDGNLFFTSGGSLSFLGTANDLTINGRTYRLESSIATLAAAISHKPSGYYALSASYDASHDGTYKTSPVQTKVKGAINGLGNSISNLTIDGNNPALGLFSYVDKKGSISSLLVTGAKIVVVANREAGSSVSAVLAVRNAGTIFNSFASGEIDGTIGNHGVLYLGGLVGGNSGTIFGSASDTILQSSTGRSPGATFTGGLVADNAATIEGSYATGTTTVGTSGSISGGLVGENGGVIQNCYAEGAVSTSNGGWVGGLVGATFTPSVSDAYSTGAPYAGSDSSVGGSIGYDDGQGGQSSDYWDTTTSGITNLSQGAGNIANDPGVTGETTAQLQAALPSGFDPKIWAESPSINSGLPYLIANPPQ